MLTEQQAIDLIAKALEIHAAREPRPSTVTIAEAAEMLGVCERTVRRMKPKRAAGNRIAYAWVLERLASK